MSHKTVAGRVAIFERLYAIFCLPPFGAPRLENLVASHLLKWVHHEQDVAGRDLELRYFRDTDGREVDFVVVEGRTPIMFVECKWGDQPIDKGLRYLKTRFPDCDAWQIHMNCGKDFQIPEGIRVAPALAPLETLI